MPNWSMQTTWSSGSRFFHAASRFAQQVSIFSSGELIITPYVDGDIVPAFQAQDACRSGTVEMCHDWPAYWQSTNSAFVPFGSVPFGLKSAEFSAWFLAGGGWTLANSLYATYGLVPFPTGDGGPVTGMWTKTPITNLRQLAGKTVRVSGWTLDILTQIGVTTVLLPEGQILTALQSGTIAAADFASPSIDWDLGFYQTTKYVAGPGWNKPNIQLMASVNQAAYDTLSLNSKNALRYAAIYTQGFGNSHVYKADADKIPLYLSGGVKFTSLSSDCLDELKTISDSLIDSYRSSNSTLDEIMSSYYSFQDNLKVLDNIRQGASLGWASTLPGQIVSFDGVGKIIYVQSDTVELDVKRDLYSAWKEWVVYSDNSKYVPAFRSIGGDPVDSGVNSGDIYFLMNGWKIYVDHTLDVIGVLYAEDGSSPFHTPNIANVIRSSVSNLVQGISVERVTQVVWDSQSSTHVTPGSKGSESKIVANMLKILLVK